jgi:1,4-dihydroxy-2-naphthoate octaprenyltransferase
MPLSAHEQRVINDLEDHLAASDPRLARRLSRHGENHGVPRLAVFVVASAAPGLALLILALFLQSVVLGVGAYLIMAAGVYAFTKPPFVSGLRHGRRKNCRETRSTPLP